MKTDWSILSEADLAMLRYSILLDMQRIERGAFPLWHWQKEHRMLLEVKQTTHTKTPEER